MSGTDDPGSLEGIILAAGRSRRAGTFKPALPVGGRPMIDAALDGMLEVCSRVIVVGGHEYARLRAILAGRERVVCLENPRHHLGMFTSVKRGIAETAAHRCFVLPVDVPCVPARVYRALAAMQDPIAVPCYGGRRGHPVLLRREVFPPLLARPDSSSLRAFIHEIGFATLEVDAAEVLMDIDTPEDYRRLTSPPSDRKP